MTLERVHCYIVDALKMMIAGTPQLTEKELPILSPQMTNASETINGEALKVFE
jgi:hypothetical protein